VSSRAEPCISYRGCTQLSWLWQPTPRFVRRKPAPVPLCPQIPRTRVAAVGSQRLRLSYGTAEVLCYSSDMDWWCRCILKYEHIRWPERQDGVTLMQAAPVDLVCTNFPTSHFVVLTFSSWLYMGSKLESHDDCISHRTFLRGDMSEMKPQSWGLWMW
jgi:hypothetical protein